MLAARLGWRRFTDLVITALFTCAGSTPLHAAEGVPANEDLRHVRAPDGSRVFIRVTDATADGGRHHLWLVDVGANTARQLTFSPAADKSGEHNGRWLGAMLQYPRDNHGPLGANMYGFPSTEPWHGFDARRRLVQFFKTAFDRSDAGN
jgi:hypothetical protein